jgi:hypothetical protein
MLVDSLINTVKSDDNQESEISEKESVKRRKLVNELKGRLEGYKSQIASSGYKSVFTS